MSTKKVEIEFNQIPHFLNQLPNFRLSTVVLFKIALKKLRPILQNSEHSQVYEKELASHGTSGKFLQDSMKVFTILATSATALAFLRSA